jgi:23S rRNA (uracil1939-C5)-methyltransferase
MEVKIEKLIYGGEGLGHADGATVFVPYVLPDEVVAIDPVERKKKFIRGKLESVITPSPLRIAPRCPYFGTCGGCHYQHQPYEAQVPSKVAILGETLRRLGHIEWTGQIETHVASPWGYRNRAQWKVRPPGKSDDTDARRLTGVGYFRAGSTSLVPVDQCAILSPLLESTLRALDTALRNGSLPNSLREMEAFADAKDEKLILNASFVGFPTNIPALAASFRALIPQAESILFHEPARDRMELFGPGFLRYDTEKNSYRVGHMSFFQVNRFLIDEMVRVVTAPPPDAGGKRQKLALDLFAGVGLFTVPLAEHFERVVAVEANPASVRDLELNIDMVNGTVEPRTADVEEFLYKYRESPDLLVLDPPRAGLEPGSVNRLTHMRVKRITYVSCEPSTLARDLAVLVNSGFRVEEIHLFDLFPQTFHIESIVKLVRDK